MGEGARLLAVNRLARAEHRFLFLPLDDLPAIADRRPDRLMVQRVHVRHVEFPPSEGVEQPLELRRHVVCGHLGQRRTGMAAAAGAPAGAVEQTAADQGSEVVEPMA